MGYVSIHQLRVSTSHSHPQIQEITRYDNVTGPVLTMCGIAIKVLNEPFNDNSTACYLNKNSLIKRLFPTTNQALNLDSLKRTTSIHRLVMQILNPTIGLPITMPQISRLFDLVRVPECTEELDGCAYEHEAVEIIEERLKTIRYIDLEFVPYNHVLLREKLQPGDIFCRRIEDGYHNNVVMGQRMEKLFIKEPKERDADNFSHLAIYLGDGRVAEAAWPTGRGDEIRIVELDDPRFAIKHFSHFRYVVVRCKDPVLAQNAAQVASKLADDVGKLNAKNQHTRLRYSIPLALECVLFPSSFGPCAKERYLEQYVDDAEDTLPRHFLSPTGLFCSYLVGLAYQVAESRRVCPIIMGHDNGPEEDDNKTGCTEAISRQIWAKTRRWRYYEEMDREVKLKFDARRISPQNFRNFVGRNPDLFEDKMIIGKATENHVIAVQG